MRAVTTIDSDRPEAADYESSESHYATRETGVPRAPGWKAAVRILGWTLAVAGVVLLEFAAFLVWGTGVQAAREQERLRREFGVSVDASSGPGTAGSGSPRAEMRAEPGKPLARLRIPAIGLDSVVVEGVGHDELKMGPGHIPESVLPGRAGKSVISGHRTTYGAPFGDLDRLQSGSEILVSTVEGETRYVVTRSYVVLPEDTSVTAPLAPSARPRLALVTCHPKFSAAKRLVVEADLVSPPTR